jgi:DNA-binding FadR family transcriptional regulator
MDKDMEFHRLIAEGARNRRLVNALGMIYGQIAIMAVSAKNDETLRKQAHYHHQKILDAIMRQDVQLGEQSVLEHIIEIKEYHISRYMVASGRQNKE